MADDERAPDGGDVVGQLAAGGVGVELDPAGRQPVGAERDLEGLHRGADGDRVAVDHDEDLGGVRERRRPLEGPGHRAEAPATVRGDTEQAPPGVAVAPEAGRGEPRRLVEEVAVDGPVRERLERGAGLERPGDRRGTPVAEHVVGRVADEVVGGPVAGDVGAAHQHERRAVGLPAGEVGRAGELVGDRDQRDLERAALEVTGPALVAERPDAGGAERHVGLAHPPGTAERVGDDHPDGAAGRGRQPGGEVGGGRVRVGGQQERATAGDVGGVDAGVGAHEAVPGLDDQHPRGVGHDADGLLLRELAAGGVDVGGRRQVDERALGLAHDLRRDADDVAGDELDAGVGRCGEHQVGEVVAGADAAVGGQRDQLDARHQVRRSRRAASSRVVRASAVATSRSSIIVSVTATATPSSSSIRLARSASRSSMTQPSRRSR